MCTAKRIISTQCGHAIWGKVVRVCEQQIAFQTSPTTSIECDTLFSHPIHSLKIDRLCKECENKRGLLTRTTEKCKQALKDIRESVERMEEKIQAKKKVQAEKEVIETAKKASVDTDDNDLEALESWD
ncbi:hypothetical protein NHQ30_003694 [Ciborinia camelliae]|nr:hypothetical protein NHQ30_003694 [Ciborinia camelliae]